MEKRTYELTFLTPAFLGDAEQNARWRTPPIKHLLRAWWRVAWAQDHDFKTDHRAIQEMRTAEGNLFGNAWLSDEEGGNRKSRLRMRLDTWDIGKLRKWDSHAEQRVYHPEVGAGGNGMQVGAELYLGFGPLTNKGGTNLKANAAIQAGESATLRLALPSNEVSRIDRTMQWIDRFGNLGGRSRNGWGAICLRENQTSWGKDMSLPLRPWAKALRAEWPHAVGTDDAGPLIWQTTVQTNWHALMQTLAAIKIGFRTQLPFTTGHGAERPEERHWLSYPVTNHSVRGWGNLRLPNSLRFTACQDAQGQLRGVIYHMPIRPPADFRPDDQALHSAWSAVHRYLDKQCQGLDRIKE